MNSKNPPSTAGSGTPTPMFGTDENFVFCVPAEPLATSLRREVGTSSLPTPTEVPNHCEPTRTTTTLSVPVSTWASAPTTSAELTRSASRTARAFRYASWRAAASRRSRRNERVSSYDAIANVVESRNASVANTTVTRMRKPTRYLPMAAWLGSA